MLPNESHMEDTAAGCDGVSAKKEQANFVTHIYPPTPSMPAGILGIFCKKNTPSQNFRRVLNAIHNIFCSDADSDLCRLPCPTCLLISKVYVTPTGIVFFS